jgi:hypothetical protein
MSDFYASSSSAINNPLGAGVLSASLWACQVCQVWWGSQVGNHEEARYLLRLASPNTDLFEWINFRGWHLKADEANKCPDCGQQTGVPRFSVWS